MQIRIRKKREMKMMMMCIGYLTVLVTSINPRAKSKKRTQAPRRRRKAIFRSGSMNIGEKRIGPGRSGGRWRRRRRGTEKIRRVREQHRLGLK
jgi:hypothetical protein